jgi:hypothetical protein
MLLLDFGSSYYSFSSGFTPSNSDFCFRNEEAGGSNPLSSTKLLNEHAGF